jgi:hypothetical protein
MNITCDKSTDNKKYIRREGKHAVWDRAGSTFQIDAWRRLGFDRRNMARYN